MAALAEHNGRISQILSKKNSSFLRDSVIWLYIKKIIIRLQLKKAKKQEVKFNAVESEFNDSKSKIDKYFLDKNHSKNGHCVEVSYRIRQKGEHEMEQARQAYVTVQ